MSSPARPLQSAESEYSVLGAMLQFPDTQAEAIELLRPEMFGSRVHGALFGLFVEMFSRGITIDPMTVHAESGSRGLSEEFPASLLSGLIEAVPTGAGVGAYARKIRDLYSLRSLVSSCQTTIEEATAPSALSVPDLMDRAESRLLDISGLHSPGREVSIGEATQEAMGRIKERVRTGTPPGVTTGFPDLDTLTGGLKPGELILIAARPSMGKTALVQAMCTAAAKSSGKTALLFSLEQSGEELSERMLATEGRVDLARIRMGRLDQAEQSRLAHAQDRLSDLPVLIDDDPGSTVLELRAKARRLARTHDLGMVAIDYIQLMAGDRRTDNRVQEVSEISRGLKLLAKELRVPVVALSQLSRAPETRTNHRPQLSDLRDSGSLEQDADVVLFLLRPEYYLERREALLQGLVGACEVIVGKQRNGPRDTVRLRFDAEYTRFESLAPGPIRDTG